MASRRVLVSAAVLLAALAVVVVAAVARDGGSVVLVLSPHPDDEMQAWGALQESAGDHVVLAFLTRGEATGQCQADLPGWQDGTGELPPEPRPEGRGTATCQDARVNATVAFLEEMGAVTSWLPTTLQDRGRVDDLADPEGVAERCDAEGEPCRSGPGDVRVFTGDGVTALFFDLGDGDVTPAEVAWAARATRSPSFAAWVPEAEVGRVVGASYYNDPDAPRGEAACATYPHPDHAAVTAVLRDVDLGLGGRQVFPTCRTDEVTSIVAPVDAPVWRAAFEIDGQQRVGHHPVRYGWLLTPYFAGDGATCDDGEPPCDDVQQELFHRYQTFGVRE